MSRYHSIYAAQERSARWPWVVAALIVLAGIGVAVWILSGASADRLLEAARLQTVSRTTPEPSAMAGLVPEPSPTARPEETNQRTATAEPTPVPPATRTPEPTAVKETSQNLHAQSQEAATPAPSPVSPSPAPADPIFITDAVQEWAARWEAGDYDGMFALVSMDSWQALARRVYVDQHGNDEGFEALSEAQQRQLARDYFVGRYQGIAEEAGLTNVKITEIGEPDLETQVPIHVVMESSKIGTIEEDNRIQLRWEGDGWKVAWTPSLIFKDLGDGCIDFTTDPVKRGAILDRNGEMLAYDGIVNEVGVIPKLFENEEAEVQALSKLLGISVSDIKARYKDANPDWFVPITDLPEPMEQRILNGLSQLPGVAVRDKTARIYPYGPIAAHVTGYVQAVTAEDLAADTEGRLSETDVIGRAGIEAAANDLLTGKPGARLRVVECQTRAERVVIAKRRPVPAKDLVLTIDIRLQKAVDEALGNVKGSAVVLDPRNGAVLALVSHPTFDPNLFVKGLTEADAKYIFSERQRPLLNRATQAAYPTGSIFKVITMAAAMEHLGYTGQSEIDCPQEWSIPGTESVFRDWTYEYGTGPQGVLTLHNALVQSCNTVFYELGYELDKKDSRLLPDMAKAFGLGAPTNIPYLQEIAGTVPDPAWKLDVLNDYWAHGDAVNLAIGQGYLEATPLQMANAYAAIANGGTLLQPFIVEFSRDADGTQTRIGKRRVIRELPISEANLEEIRSALRDQTSNPWGVGSAKVFGDFDWPIAGKTGTAQNQLNKAEKPHSWFAAFGPYGGRATIASIVMVESSGEGVSFAAPRTRQIYEAYLKLDLADA